MLTKKILINFKNISSNYIFIKTIIFFICFILSVGAYTLLKEVKDAVFMIIVGKSYLPDAKLLSFFIMIPLTFLYSFIANNVKKHFILIIYSIIYGTGGLFLSLFLDHPTIGINNQISDPNRLFGWIFYLFLEGHFPFIVSGLWALFNSVSEPKDINASYILMTIGTKVGALFSATLAWAISSRYIFINFSDIKKYILIIKISSIFTLFIPFFILFLFYKLPEKILIGYSKKNNYLQEKKECGGFKLFFKFPYVLGIFGMVFFWEIINIVFNYIRLQMAFNSAKNISDITSFLYRDAMIAHFIGLLFVIFGTSFIIRFFGERKSLLFVPILTGIAILIFLFYKTKISMIISYIVIRSINTALASPLREALYIPTTNEIQFKTKSWIDSFGAKFAKGTGSLYNKISQIIPIYFMYLFQISFFLAIIIAWTALAYLLGQKWKKAVKKNEVIGI
jgi:AAA family ATP:ADP antiporter